MLSFLAEFSKRIKSVLAYPMGGVTDDGKFRLVTWFYHEGTKAQSISESKTSSDLEHSKVTSCRVKRLLRTVRLVDGRHEQKSSFLIRVIRGLEFLSCCGL
jgi:hypothetical protein